MCYSQPVKSPPLPPVQVVFSPPCEGELHHLQINQSSPPFSYKFLKVFQATMKHFPGVNILMKKHQNDLSGYTENCGLKQENIPRMKISHVALQAGGRWTGFPRICRAQTGGFVLLSHGEDRGFRLASGFLSAEATKKNICGMQERKGGEERKGKKKRNDKRQTSLARTVASSCWVVCGRGSWSSYPASFWNFTSLENKK